MTRAEELAEQVRPYVRLPGSVAVESYFTELVRLATSAEALAEALGEADKLLAGMWSYNDDSRKHLTHTWPVKASDVLRAALARYRGEKP